MRIAYEKITLYDFFGYLIPGLFLVLVTYIRFAEMIPESVKDIYSDRDALLVGSCLLFGYIAGIIVSELTRLSIFDKVKITEYFEGIDLEKLKESGLRSGLFKIDGNLTVEEEKKIFERIYASLQNDEGYKRIHNYASMEVMCKNLSAVALILAIEGFCFIDKCVDLRECMGVLIGIVISYLLRKRYHRFRCKKSRLAILNFIQKHSTQKKK